MVQLIPTNDNPTGNEIDAYICEMLNANNYGGLNDVVREIHSKSGVGALLHPSEEYFVSRFNQQREKHVA
jgi:hypothetical protein